MEMLKKIESIAEDCMCRDRNRLFRELRAVKKMKKKEGREKADSRLYRLLKSARRSADQRNRRMEAMPLPLEYNPDLPITGKKEEIIRAVQENPVIIISGETGSGKTTQIPKFCLEAGRGTAGMIGCTQPRRIAAINVAKRIAFELNQPLGRSVGYKIRFDDKTPAHAHIKLMTDGILLAETQQDRFLTQYDTLIVDEAHERSLNIDFTLGLLRRLIKQRKDLKLIITSATIDTQKFSAAFDRAPVIEVSGRMFPVETLYRPMIDSQGETQDDQAYVEAAAAEAEALISRTRSGDILIFMPTEQDIGETMEILRGKNHPGVSILPLFARLSAKEQARVFSSSPGRKVIVSTNVAETSLTIPGIRYVVDTGLARIPSYSPRTRTTALPVQAISQSSANQRLGRCGRVENGVCIRLFDEEDFSGRPFFTAPEILRSNLAEVILRMISLNLGDVAEFPFIDPPAPKSIRDGFDTLMELSAIRAKKISSKNVRTNGDKKGKKAYELTRTGRLMAKIPVDPKLSRILIEAQKNACLKEAVVIVTALAISDVRQRPADKAQAADQKHGLFRDPSSDFITLLNIWNAYKEVEKKLQTRSKLKKFCTDHFLSFKRIREWQDIHRQITRMLREHGFSPDQSLDPPKSSIGLKSKEFELGGPLYIALHKSLLAGYLGHIAHKKEKNIFNATKGRQAMIFPGSGLFNRAGSWIVAAEFVKTTQLFARGVANIDPAWLEEVGKEICTYTYSNPRWEKKRGEVVADEQVSLFGLIIVSGRPRAYGRINPDEAGEIFIRQALIQGQTHMRFKFMDNNQSLMEDLEDLENKTRQRDILASEEDIFLFYQSRLPRPFFNIRTFARYIKELEDDAFLHMSLEELQRSRVNEEKLALFPDTLETEQGRFALEYAFNPGAEDDGVTLKVPVSQVTQVPRQSLDKLVPGLLEEKIIALIKNLPKKYRVRLVPVQETAARIARDIIGQDKPLFTLLSSWIREKLHLTIPASVWSEDNLADHLKMRISIQDEKGKPIKTMRDLSILGEFPDRKKQPETDAVDRVRKEFERTGIREWSFPDLEPQDIPLANGLSQKLYPGLKIEGDDLCLRLFTSRAQAEKEHARGVARLFQICFPEDFKAMKKDIKMASGLRQIAPYFSTPGDFTSSVTRALVRALFAENIRTRARFLAHAQAVRPDLYNLTMEFIRTVLALGEEYGECFSLIQKLSLKHEKSPATFTILTRLFQDLKNLVPPNFLELYDLDRIKELHRYIACIRIRAQRGADNPVRESQKSSLIQPFQRQLETLVASLSDTSSREKADRAEAFYWLLEEYKISVFAQEIKTRVKVSAKILEKEMSAISTMI
ncbi:ATP-dependent RNA helicase HrpA [Desulfospira joergensenii]|uniref:ATP-dependent RNA helicase HrpA n=1 Tax=Desulfospira joergensenii TaxID=53329 RepID=UPI00042161B9|nr:ATP-dependent RNA helicase HrpA [Desulfospira joergensenii]